MEVTLRPAVTEDAADLAAIQAASWNAAFFEILTPEILRNIPTCPTGRDVSKYSSFAGDSNDTGTC